MTPDREWKELRERFWKMIDSIILLLLSLCHLAVAVVILFTVAGITCFRMWRKGLDGIALKITAPKEVAL